MKQLKLLGLLLILLLSSTSRAQDFEDMPRAYPLKITKVISCNLVEGDVDLGFGHILKKEKIYLYRVKESDFNSNKDGIIFIEKWLKKNPRIHLITVAEAARTGDFITGMIAPNDRKTKKGGATLNFEILDLHDRWPSAKEEEDVPEIIEK